MAFLSVEAYRWLFYLSWCSHAPSFRRTPSLRWPVAQAHQQLVPDGEEALGKPGAPQAALFGWLEGQASSPVNGWPGANSTLWEAYVCYVIHMVYIRFGSIRAKSSAATKQRRILAARIHRQCGCPFWPESEFYKNHPFLGSTSPA